MDSEDEIENRFEAPALLLAGFGSFPGAPINPAKRLVLDFDAGSIDAPIRLHRLVVPVEWDRSRSILRDAIMRCGAGSVLLFGLHAGIDRFRIELAARNERVTDRPDAAGRLAGSDRICDGPPSVRAHMPLREIGSQLDEAGIGFELSEDAGRYLCNETLFDLCLAARPLGLRHFGFVHTPCTQEVAALFPAAENPSAGGGVVSAADLDRVAAIILGCMARAFHNHPARVGGEF